MLKYGLFNGVALNKKFNKNGFHSKPVHNKEYIKTKIKNSAIKNS